MAMPWLLPKRITASRPAVTKKSRKCKHEIFARLANVCQDDDFYREKFQELSSNKGITGFKFEGNTLRKIATRGTKRQESLHIGENSSIKDEELPELAERVKKFLLNNSVMVVQRENSEAMVFHSDITWKDLNKKSKSNYIYDFALYKKQEYNLSWKEVNQLVTEINIYLLAKQLSNEDFAFYNGKLYAINGLSFDQQSRLWSFPGKRITIPKNYNFVLHAADIIISKIICSTSDTSRASATTITDE